jgi:hypothetical protein
MLRGGQLYSSLQCRETLFGEPIVVSDPERNQSWRDGESCRAGHKG